MAIEKNLKIGIFAGLISAIIFIYFLNPILSFIGKIILGVSSRIYKSYIDRIFERLALGSEYNHSFFLSSLFLLLLISAGIGFMYYVFSDMKSIKKQLGKDEDD